MRSNAAVYIDAGYLLAAAATRLTGSSFRRGIQPDFPLLIGALLEQAETIAGRPVLRSYWYDAAKDQSPDAEHQVIEMIPRVKLRLGRIGNEGQQKGVDLKIGLDMVTHARNGAIDTLVLVSGDDDLTEAVDQAQVNGVEVVVLAVPGRDGRPHGVSRHLQAAADRLELVDAACLEQSIVRRVATTTPVEAVSAVLAAPAAEPASTPVMVASSSKGPSPADLMRKRPVAPAYTPAPVYSTSTGQPAHSVYEEEHPTVVRDPRIDTVARASLDVFLAYATPSQLADLKTGRPSIPRELDSTLLRDLSDALGIYTLDDIERRALRDAFWAAVDELDS